LSLCRDVLLGSDKDLVKAAREAGINKENTAPRYAEFFHHRQLFATKQPARSADVRLRRDLNNYTQ